ncbi:hypothetical protein HOP62_01370 [Halomonas sp. MCCC 1A17488]|uniref:DUF488 family protein n=1 Tax=Billgrantia sulfidoxydans TaxID=2733484 RepID=A0ABX7W911_9GAMM|nr:MULTISPECIES: DUF488 family protein [Halomonas]MCE8014723.1 hypothetical protein [Halomonas sp. MCCC 1A17488]MCG3238056.1 hypothetical protein [Halomonas sp. MCCC 1A17488]QPP48167.1 hypothetical protein I4484_13030 [Halomonas sp. SS10-MC5]QTP55469.1 hypothetical protein HNO51_12715 [Halomonas sulfidoxydans]
MSYAISLKRIYSPHAPEDGARVLVDRLWPRGKRRESLALTEWYRDASPSPLLNRQLRQDEISPKVFAVRYRGELRDHPECLIPLMRYARQGKLTLLSAARNLEESYLPLLRQALLEALRQEDAEDLEPASPPCYRHQLRDE